MVKKLSLKTIMFAVIAIAMFVCGIVALASFANIKPANVNVEKQIETRVSAEGNEARIGETEYATLEEAFTAANEMTEAVTIYCIASEIVVDSTIVCGAVDIILLCDGTNVTITRNFDGVLFKVSKVNWRNLTIGETTNDQYQFTINGNNKAYPLFTMNANKVVINCGIFMGNADGIATVESQSGGLALVPSSENQIEINGGTFKNFYANVGGVIFCNSDNIWDAVVITGGIFINNKASTYGGVIFGSGEMKISGGLFENNSAVIGGAIFTMFGNYNNVYIFGGTFNNNTATGDENIDSGIGNDIFNFGAHIHFFDVEIDDVVMSSLIIEEYQLNLIAEFNCFGGKLNKISFLSCPDALVQMIFGSELPSGAYTKSGTINIYNDFDLTGAIYLTGEDQQIINVATISDDLKNQIKEDIDIDVTSISALANTYKIDGSAENFATYYQDTGKAIVTYDSVEVDKNDFTCTNGSIITSAQVEGGSATSLYLTAPTESTPSTGFVDEQLLPMIAVAFLSTLIVVYALKVSKKQKQY